ncbi:hypothetical protein MNBD_NITROSPINAE05-935 [hydrothermal vent metagenome]|uniref:Uncharacterized protein n=1 Tax=hydrothermal vent metagenome TaxID=652676 RepID=A0A3B1CIT4_9ZZZZ
MQCSRCSYIQFRSSSKCANCGYDFKKLKSGNVAEVENTFTIFATAGAVAGSDFNETAAAGLDEGYQEESATTDMEGTELYGSPSDEHENQSEDDHFGDFALDLSEADNPDSEGWNIGATLTEDLSATTNADPDDFLKDADLETGEFEVQGLGFDFNADSSQTEPEVSDDDAPGNTQATNEASPELDDFFLPDEPDSDEISLETELPDSDMEAETEPTYEEPVELKVPVVELPISEIEPTVPEVKLTVSEAEPTAPEVELHSSIELENLSLNLETDFSKVEPATEEQPKSPEASLDGLELRMDSDEDESSEEEPTPKD